MELVEIASGGFSPHCCFICQIFCASASEARARVMDDGGIEIDPVLVNALKHLSTRYSMSFIEKKKKEKTMYLDDVDWFEGL